MQQVEFPGRYHVHLLQRGQWCSITPQRASYFVRLVGAKRLPPPGSETIITSGNAEYGPLVVVNRAGQYELRRCQE
jgi:hypothetical protein